MNSLVKFCSVVSVCVIFFGGGDQLNKWRYEIAQATINLIELPREGN